MVDGSESNCPNCTCTICLELSINTSFKLKIYNYFRVVKNSLLTWWTCWENNQGQDPSPPRRSRGWWTSSIGNLTQSRSSWSSPLARLSWSSDPGFWTQEEKDETSAKTRVRCSMSIFILICPIHIRARRQRKNWQGNVESQYHR